MWSNISSLKSLNHAWNKVRENQGGPGVDQITVEQFAQNLEENLRTLQGELQDGVYRPLPALRIYVNKDDGGQRSIGIPAVRDRVVQQSLLSELSPIFEPQFLDCSFAYRPGRSALDAIKRVESLLKEVCQWVLDGDIEGFFDSIDRALLLGFVAESVSDASILKLIEAFLNAGVFEDMGLHDGYLGIAQGNVISPLLANIYLHRFDLALTHKGYHLIRYADDFVLLEDSQEKATKALADAAIALQTLKLNLNEKKTSLLHARSGFVFLGYYIDSRGKGPSKKAIEAIQRKLHDISVTHKDSGEIIEDLKRSVRGWSNYFGGCRGLEPEDPCALIALIEISLEFDDGETARKLLEKGRSLPCENPDLRFEIGKLSERLDMPGEALDEYAQALALNPDHIQAKDAAKRLQLVDEDAHASIERLKRLIHLCPDLPQAYRDLACCYAELGEYGLAQESQSKALELESEQASKEKPLPEVFIPAAQPAPLTYSQEDIALFLSLFRGNPKAYARQWVDEEGRRGFSPVDHPLDTTEIQSHLRGEETLGLYLMTAENRVYLSVIDVDISQKALLEYAKDKSRIAELQNLANQDAIKMSSVCDDLRIPPLLEDSGYKGRHLWFFFATAIEAKTARNLLKFICDRAGEPAGGIHWEIFPGSDKLRGKGLGSLIKLPFGIHKRTNRRCLLLDKRGHPLPDQMLALSQVAQITPQKVEEILLAYCIKPRASTEKGQQSPLVESLLSGCKVINHLVAKARDTHYLDNAERVTLLYTLGHLGQEGKDSLHKVISYCLNYDYDYTEKHIKKIKPYPISCARIQEKHEDIALDVGCNCTFRLPRKGYPSPILHAFQRTKVWPPKGITYNLETVASAKEEETTTDINVKLKRYIEIKKQLAGIEKSLSRIEQEMSQFFDQAGTDTLLTEYGFLVRKKTANGLEWIIKL